MRVSLERILDRMAHIAISDEHHGPPGDRDYRYDPTSLFRGHTDLHLELTPND